MRIQYGCSPLGLIKQQTPKSSCNETLRRLTL